MFKLTPFNASSRKDAFDPFTDFFEDFFSPMRLIKNDTFKVDVEEKADQYLIKADLPGVNKEALKLSYDTQTLHILVEHKEEKENQDDKNYIHRERQFSSMRRRLYLPDVNPSKIRATLNNGVLHIEAKKRDGQTQGTVIDVK